MPGIWFGMNGDKAQQHVELSESDFEAEVLQSTLPVLVAFTAPWSRPCQVIRQVVDDVASACAGTAKVVSVDVDNYPDLGVWFDIQSIPTLLWFLEGKERARIIGTASKEAILAKLGPLLRTP